MAEKMWLSERRAASLIVYRSTVHHPDGTTTHATLEDRSALHLARTTISALLELLLVVFKTIMLYPKDIRQQAITFAFSEFNSVDRLKDLVNFEVGRPDSWLTEVGEQLEILDDANRQHMLNHSLLGGIILDYNYVTRQRVSRAKERLSLAVLKLIFVSGLDLSLMFDFPWAMEQKNILNLSEEQREIFPVKFVALLIVCLLNIVYMIKWKRYPKIALERFVRDLKAEEARLLSEDALKKDRQILLDIAHKVGFDVGRHILELRGPMPLT